MYFEYEEVISRQQSQHGEVQMNYLGRVLFHLEDDNGPPLGLLGPVGATLRRVSSAQYFRQDGARKKSRSSYARQPVDQPQKRGCSEAEPLIFVG